MLGRIFETIADFNYRGQGKLIELGSIKLVRNTFIAIRFYLENCFGFVILESNSDTKRNWPWVSILPKWCVFNALYFHCLTNKDKNFSNFASTALYAKTKFSAE